MSDIKDLLEERKLVSKNLSYYLAEANKYRQRLIDIDKALRGV